METCRKFSIEFEIPEVVYNVKSSSICNFCTPQQSVRDCISHILENHLHEIFQRTNYVDTMKNLQCCIQEYTTASLRDFVFHFGMNHGPVGFRTSGNFTFFVTHTPFLEPHFGNENLEQMEQHVKPTMIFQTVPQDNYEDELHSKVLKMFVNDYHKVITKQISLLKDMRKLVLPSKRDISKKVVDEMVEVEKNKGKFPIEDHVIRQIYNNSCESYRYPELYDLRTSLFELQLKTCKKLLVQCADTWKNFKKYGCTGRQIQNENMMEIERTTNSIMMYTKHCVLVNQRIHDGKFSIIEEEEDGILRQFVKIDKLEGDENALIFFKKEKKTY